MPEDQTIVGYAIHPGIGIARVGNAPDLFFIGPETPGQQPVSPVQCEAHNGQTVPSWKDDKGKVLRQAARFRVYGVNAAGEAVKEIVDGDGVNIRWRVHLANRKAAWYGFMNAMDLGKYAIEEQLRNADFQGEDRQKLVIDGGTREISGKNEQGSQYHFDQGWFVKEASIVGSATWPP